LDRHIGKMISFEVVLVVGGALAAILFTVILAI
jgi:hypothetical protein